MQTKLMRYDIINMIAKQIKAKSYLEIGVQGKVCFNKIDIAYKKCVDPDHSAKADYVLTSDEFFNVNYKKFDIIFIDGLHHADQVYIDILNSLLALNENGVIVCHDMNPEKEEIQRVPRVTKEWTGNCWQALVRLRFEKKLISSFVVDTDYGVGVIRKSNFAQLYNLNIEFTYDFLNKNRKELLNLISENEFKEELKKFECIK